MIYLIFLLLIIVLLAKLPITHVITGLYQLFSGSIKLTFFIIVVVLPLWIGLGFLIRLIIRFV